MNNDNKLQNILQILEGYDLQVKQAIKEGEKLVDDNKYLLISQRLKKIITRKQVTKEV